MSYCAGQPAYCPVIYDPIQGVRKVVIAAGIGVAAELRITIAAK